MNSKYTVWTAFRLKTGDVAVSGSIDGPELMIGWRGSAQTSHGPIEVIVVGVGVSHRPSEPDRLGILVRMVRGEAEHMIGATIEFTGV
jgi:hypothetical protein